MDSAREVFENAPNTASEVEIEGIKIVDFRDSVNMVTFESHGEERRLKHGGNGRCIKGGVERHNIHRAGGSGKS